MLRYLDRIVWIPLIVVLAAVVGWVALIATGHRTLVVMSGSMSPALAPGDVAIVDTVIPGAVHAGDVVTFRDPTRDEELVTHRAVLVQPLGDVVGFVTKGDSNSGVEEWTVATDGRVGRVGAIIPAIGRVLIWLQLPAVRLVMIAAAFALLAVVTARFALQMRGAVSGQAALLAAVVATGALLLGGMIPRTFAAFSSATANAPNTFQAAASFCTPGTRTVYATADAWVDEDQPNQNNGQGIDLWVRAGNPKSRRTLVRFDLPSLGACSLTSATLQLYASASSGPAVITASRISAPWTENSVTFANQPATSGPVVTSPDGLGPRTWNVTSIVQAMYAGTNEGILVKDQSEAATPHEQHYASRETALGPALTVMYG